jgi:integrase
MPTTDVLDTYLAHVETLLIGSSSRATRRRGAKLLTERHPDLQAWMTRPVPARVAELHRLKAWPFVIWCAVTGRMQADVELLLAKPGGVDLASVWEAAHPGDIGRAADLGRMLGWSENWTRQVVRHALPVLCAWVGKALDELADHDLTRFIDEVERSVFLSASARYRVHTRLFAMGQILFQLGALSRPPRQFNRSLARTPVELATSVPQPAIRGEVVRYAQTISTVLRPATAYARVKAVRVFCDWLADQHPEVGRLDQLERTGHVEPFIAWSRTRPWRGPNGRGRTISLRQFHHDLVDLRVFFEDIAAWGWTSQPRQRLLFLSDLPRIPEPMPRALPPVTDSTLMGAVRRLEDPLARTGLLVLRATGMRVGELLDLELDCLVDFGPHGTWLRVPVGKLGTERTVPLDQPTVDVLDAWMSMRGPQRALPHPRDGRPADFVFMEHGRRATSWRLAKALDRAAALAGLMRPDGSPAHFTLHQLRHTFGTSLVNAGISLPALMSLLGHVTPEMTLRYARLASPTIRTAYEAAMGRVRARTALTLLPMRAPAVPSRVDWLASEMLKTRVAHGYCSRDPVAGACPYANICEQCDNFVPAPEFAPVLKAQLADVKALRRDAEQRGWTIEGARHAGVEASLEDHLRRLDRRSPSEPIV